MLRACSLILLGPDSGLILEIYGRLVKILLEWDITIPCSNVPNKILMNFVVLFCIIFHTKKWSKFPITPLRNSLSPQITLFTLIHPQFQRSHGAIILCQNWVKVRRWWNQTTKFILFISSFQQTAKYRVITDPQSHLGNYARRLSSISLRCPIRKPLSDFQPLATSSTSVSASISSSRGIHILRDRSPFRNFWLGESLWPTENKIKLMSTTADQKDKFRQVKHTSTVIAATTTIPWTFPSRHHTFKGTIGKSRQALWSNIHH